FGAVINAGDHLRGAVRVEGVEASVGFDGDLFFEYELAVNSSCATAMQDAVEHGERVPIRRFARRSRVADSEGRQSAKRLWTSAAALFRLRRLGDIGARRHRAAGNVVEIALGKDESLGGIEIAKHEQNGIVGRIVGV